MGHPWAQQLSGTHSKQLDTVVSNHVNVSCRGESERAVGGCGSGCLLRLRPPGWEAPPKQLTTAPPSARPQPLPQGHDTLPQDE